MSRNVSRATGESEPPEGGDDVPVGKGASSSRRTRSSAAKKRRLGSYRIVALLGVGGMAQVHLAMKHGPGGFTKLLVVKSMLDELDDEIYERSFMHEARLAAQLNHPNVIQTYEVGEDNHRPFIAMEYVEGQTMRAVQRRMAPNRLPLPVQLRVIEETARGLHHAHTLKSFDGTPMNIVHRDVSPQNIMLSYDGQVKLLDFGIAKASGADELTREGMIKGKIDYMAPEQLRGEGIDHRADVFALGVMLWEAVTGKRFSGGAEVAQITKMHNRIMGKEPRLRDVAPETPMRLVEICERAVAVDSKDRYDSAEDLAQAISDYLRETSKTTDARELAKILDTMFAAERKNMRDLVEEQIRLMSSPDSGDDLDILVPVIPQTDGNTGTPLSQSDAFPRPALRKSTTRPDAPLPRSSAAPKIAAGLAGLAGVLAALYIVQSRSNGGATPSAPTTAAATVAPTDAPAGAFVVLHIDATPANATAELDGSSIDLPFDARLAADARLHRVVVNAEGHSPAARTFTLARDTRISLTLAATTVAAAEESDDEQRGGSNRRARRGADTPDVPSTTAAVAAPQPQVERQPDPPPVRQPEPGRTAETTPAVRRPRPAVDSTNPYE